MSTNERQPKTSMQRGKQAESDFEKNRSFRLRPGIRNFILFALAYSVINQLMLLSGIWDWLFYGFSTVSVTFGTLSLVIPILAIVFIWILDH